MNEIVVKQGSRIIMHYRLALENGFVVESTLDDEPLNFILGDGSLEPELEVPLLGLRATEKKLFHYKAGEVFGEPDPLAIQVMSRSEFGSIDSESFQKGMLLGFELPSGEEVSGRIVDIDSESVTVDFNHPLSGRAFEFEVEVLSIN